MQLALNVALGFDSYLVMRHGVHPLVADASLQRSTRPDAAVAEEVASAVLATATVTEEASAGAGPTVVSGAAAAESEGTAAVAQAAQPALACYFCSDVVAPRDVRVSATHRPHFCTFLRGFCRAPALTRAMTHASVSIFTCTSVSHFLSVRSIYRV
jgi:hypothetical protein